MAINQHIPIIEKLFRKGYALIDGTDDLFEADLALWEFERLSKNELLKRSAYLKLVDGLETTHYKTCNLQNLEEIHKDSSFRTKLFFLNGKYSTGYATHSLFPYRGKFHPQLIRALLNILGIKPGDIVLDPMAGSSTLAVEANLLGIDAISVDISPFCTLMGKVKTFSLNLDYSKLESIMHDQKISPKLFMDLKSPAEFLNLINEDEKPYYEIFLLAFLDTMGFAKRSQSSIETLFPRVLKRYILTIRNFQIAREKLNLEIGKSEIKEGDILNLDIQDNKIDAIITSPPYSFAIDYLKNDKPQLDYLGSDLEILQDRMIGLQGRGIENRIQIYFNKMSIALEQMKRVTRKNAPLVIIIGTNEIQTNGIRLEKRIIEIAEDLNIKLRFEMKKPIRGLQNTMKEETILFFENEK